MANIDLPLSYYKTLVEYSVDVMTVMEINGKIVYESPSVTTVFGYTPEEMVGKNALSYIHPFDLPYALSVIAEAKIHPEKRYLVEIRYKHKNGSWIWIECNARFFPGAGINAAVIHSRDVTKRKEATDTILKLQKAVDATSEAVFTTDENGTILYVNSAFTQLYGFTVDEVVGKVTPRILKSGQMTAEHYKKYWDTLLAKQAIKGEIVNKTKEGRLVTVEGSVNPILDEHGNIIGFVATQQDIDERKAMEKALAEGAKSLEMYKLALEHATNHIVITDPEGKILFANKSVEKITGFTNAEVIGQTPRLWGKQMDKDFYEQFWHVIKEEKKPFVGEIRNKRKNGEVYWAMASVSPIIDESGHLVGFVGVEEDITERKKAMKALEESEARFAAFMGKSPSQAWMKDKESRHVYVNETYCKFFQVTPEYMKTKTDYDLYPKDIADTLHAHDLKVLETGMAMEFEESKSSPNGEKHVWSVYKFPFKDASGEQMVGGLATDITERRKAENAINETTNEAVKFNNLTVGRELKMVELKEELAKAKAELEMLKKTQST